LSYKTALLLITIIIILYTLNKTLSLVFTGRKLRPAGIRIEAPAPIIYRSAHLAAAAAAAMLRVQLELRHAAPSSVCNNSATHLPA